MITLQAVWQDTELAVAVIEDMDDMDYGIDDILDQLVGTPYEAIISEMEIRIHH